MSGLFMHNGDWVLVGDGEKAMLFRNAGDQDFPNLEVIDLFEHESPPTREQGTDQPGRMVDATGPHKSAMEETDWHRLEKERFAKDVADALYKKAHRGHFERLFIVAPPRTLGDLRGAWHQEVSSRIVGELDKTLTNHPVHQIEKVLKGKH